ncbi:MAG: crossover junction endodeoxyribonuclease RuvC [Candidatus Harrisonbacteria bacterium]|nr:crossover junction endodeoxyribonuclease RuvC [Candidatus Harrisonbacteria bacterium]
MIILGIDPGSTRIGYGIIENNKNLELIDYGVIEVKRKESALLLKEIAAKLSDLIQKYKPELAGIEKLYFSKNVKTGIEVAQARGAIILEISRHQIPIKEFSPSEIKIAVTNYGLADKKSVAKMVSRILNVEKLGGFDDASDALAIAITTAMHKEY